MNPLAELVAAALLLWGVNGLDIPIAYGQPDSEGVAAFSTQYAGRQGFGDPCWITVRPSPEPPPSLLIVHEVGHCLGYMGHSSDFGSVMRPWINHDNALAITDADRLRLMEARPPLPYRAVAGVARD